VCSSSSSSSSSSSGSSSSNNNNKLYIMQQQVYNNEGNFKMKEPSTHFILLLNAMKFSEECVQF
jgi:hypothetical protein